MKCLVTGAAGFIGSTLAARLVSDGHDVLGLDSLTDYYDIYFKRVNIEPLAGRCNFRFIQEDLNHVDLSQVLNGVDIVFHQAGQPGVRRSWGSDFGSYLHNNVHATQRLLEAALRVGTVARVVYASSSSVYGNADHYPVVEVDPLHPHSPYGVTKLAGENLCSLYASNYGLSTVSLRYFTVYGPRQRPDMAIRKFITAILAGEQIVVNGDGCQTRDFTYVEDVVAANLSAAVGQCPPGTVLNVAGGSHLSVAQVIEEVESATGSSAQVHYTGAVAGDVGSTAGSTAAIEHTLGWRATTSFREGLDEQVRWMKQKVVD